MFLIPRYTPSFSKASLFSGIGLLRHSVKANYNAVEFVTIFDKSILDDDQHNATKFVTSIFLVFFVAFIFLKVKTRSISPPKNILNTSRYSYLSLCKLRIWRKTKRWGLLELMLIVKQSAWVPLQWVQLNLCALKYRKYETRPINPAVKSQSVSICSSLCYFP